MAILSMLTLAAAVGAASVLAARFGLALTLAVAGAARGHHGSHEG